MFYNLFKENNKVCLLSSYLCFSRGRLESTFGVSPSSGELEEVEDEEESLVGLDDDEDCDSLSVG